ncbi:MAG TPA: DUF815 domain-containing protein [Oscillatoriales cyanobacterium M59_W2019_021]|nr:MAG: ATP-binding protein [Cyanobacteria bacterium J055]HIK31970.1 DUF815 domain-containing protein [Oscillatoriales cyanobacterium M4454_W2019_049]HIK49513.1 DUF815 domain-containing protein [Oscillatoriales cyanobacterium M59_W2019_021]
MTKDESIRELHYASASLLLYRSVLDGEVGRAFLNLLQALEVRQTFELLQAYGSWFQTLASSDRTWQEYLIDRLLLTNNPFTQQIQQTPLEELPKSLVSAARRDLQILQRFYRCSSTRLCQWVHAIAPLPSSIPLVAWEEQPRKKIPQTDRERWQIQIQEKLETSENWGKNLEDLAAYYQKFGTGFFAEYRAFRWQSGQLEGIRYPDSIQLSELAAYELPKQKLLENTEFLLRGYSALHVLLYGSRGSGKSSLIKSLVWEYGDRGLRLIEVAKSELIDLPKIVDQLRHQPQKFIIFVDDLSFEEDDDAYKALKVILEGNLTERPRNVVVYATSNRRHLIREYFDDRPRPKDSDEVHAWDTVQEKLSFSDRFGLTLTFEAADQKTYLAIVNHLAQQAKIDLEPEDLQFRALQWATRNNGRSGRTARQFIDFLSAELSIKKPKPLLK